MTTTPHLGLTKDSPTGEKYSVVRVNDNSDRIDEYCYENRTRIVALETAQEQMAGDLADKIEIGDVFGIPKDITASDLDDLTEIGIHQTDDAGAAALAHSPITTGFYLRVFVMELATDTWYRQELVPKNAPRVTYMRHLHVGVGWTAWQHTGILDSAPTENSTNPVTSGGVYPVAVKAVDEGAKNLFQIDSGSTIRRFLIQCNCPAGAYHIYVGSIASTDTDKTTCKIALLSGGKEVATLQATRGSGYSSDIILSSDCDSAYIYASNTLDNSANDTITFTGAMICTAADWAVSQKFVPHAPTNRELYDGNLTTTVNNLLSYLDTTLIDTANSAFEIRRYGEMCFARISLKTITSALTGIDTITTSAIPSALRPEKSIYFPVVARNQPGWASATLVQTAISVDTSGNVMLRTCTEKANAAYVVGYFSYYAGAEPEEMK